MRKVHSMSWGVPKYRLAAEPICRCGVLGGCQVGEQGFAEKKVADARRAVPDFLPAHFREVPTVQFYQDAFPETGAVQEGAVGVGGHAEKIRNAETGPGQGSQRERRSRRTLPGWHRADRCWGSKARRASGCSEARSTRAGCLLSIPSCHGRLSMETPRFTAGRSRSAAALFLI